MVTGAASGIGLATAEAFVAEGMHVVMTDMDEARLGEHARRLSEGGASVLAIAADVRDPEALERAGQAAVEQFGALHVAVNNAGIVVTGNSWELPLAEWRRVIEVDLWGVIHGVHAFVPLILASGRGGPRRQHGVDGGGLRPRAARPVCRLQAWRARPVGRVCALNWPRSRRPSASAS